MTLAAPDSAVAPRRGGYLALIPAFGLLLVTVLWAGVYYELATGERETLAAAMRDTEAYVGTFEQFTLRELLVSDRTLRLLKSEIERTGRTDLQRMRDVGLIRGEVNLITVLDRAGNVVAANQDYAAGINAADREYFRLHAAADTGAMDISRPIVGRTSGKPVLILSRRLNAADGSFAGVVTLSLDLRLFTGFYLESSLGEQGVLGLFGLDGYYRARRAGSQESEAGNSVNPVLLESARKQQAGSFEGASPADGVDRLVAYRRLSDYPFAVVAAQTRVHALREFRERKLIFLVIAIAATAVILPFFGLLTLLNARLQKRSAQLREQSEFLRKLLDDIPLGISVRRHVPDGTGQYVVWNAANTDMFGVGAEAAIGKPVGDVARPATAHRVLEWDRELAAHPTVQEVTEAVRRSDGAMQIIHRLRAPIFGADDAIEYIVTVSKDISRERAAEDELRLASKVFETTADGIVITDAEDRVITVNSAFTRLSGYTLEDVRGLPLGASPFAPLDPTEAASRMDRLRSEGYVTAEVIRRHRDGHLLQLWVTATIVRDDDGRILNHVRVFTDISQLKSVQHELERLANFDTLTGLPNRRLFGDRLEQALHRAQRSGTGAGLLFVDLDNFKQVNDAHGHEVGDRLLQEVARRLAGCVRASDSLCRLGGDEFTVILEDAKLPEQANQVAGRILEELARPIECDGRMLDIGASIGIALFPGDGTTGETLLRRADAAMYRAKAAGGNRYEFHAGAPAPETAHK